MNLSFLLGGSNTGKSMIGTSTGSGIGSLITVSSIIFFDDEEDFFDYSDLSSGTLTTGSSITTGSDGFFEEELRDDLLDFFSSSSSTTFVMVSWTGSGSILMLIGNNSTFGSTSWSD